MKMTQVILDEIWGCGTQIHLNTIENMSEYMTLLLSEDLLQFSLNNSVIFVTVACANSILNVVHIFDTRNVYTKYAEEILSG